MRYKFQHIALKIVLVCFIVCFANVYTYGQATGDAREDFLYGEFYLEQKQYKEALPFFLSSFKSNGHNCNISFRIGECYLNIRGQEDYALPYLEMAIKNIDENYIPGKFKKPGAPSTAWLLLGNAYHRINRLQDASFAYHQYKKYVPETDKDAIKAINKKIFGLGISYEYQRNPEQVNIYNMGNTINTRFSDYNPVLSGDQRTLIYTSLWETTDRIMVSRRRSKEWSEPEDISQQLNVGNKPCYTTALSYDGNVLYLVKRLNEYNSDIYVSEFKDGSWTPAKELNKKINSSNIESSACISKDGNTLYFSSNKFGGEGGFDIYKAKKNGDDWDNVENLGKAINTKGNEEAPFISFDNSTLYFSSNGHETIGRMDILYSEIDESGNFSRPVNMGVPFNSTNDDVFFQYFSETKTGYITRDDDNSYGKQDIFVIQIGEFLPDWIDPKLEIKELASDSLLKNKTQVFGVEKTYPSKKKKINNPYLDSLKSVNRTINQQNITYVNPPKTIEPENEYTAANATESNTAETSVSNKVNEATTGENNLNAIVNSNSQNVVPTNNPGDFAPNTPNNNDNQIKTNNNLTEQHVLNDNTVSTKGPNDSIVLASKSNTVTNNSESLNPEYKHVNKQNNNEYKAIETPPSTTNLNGAKGNTAPNTAIDNNITDNNKVTTNNTTQNTAKTSAQTKVPENIKSDSATNKVQAENNSPSNKPAQNNKATQTDEMATNNLTGTLNNTINNLNEAKKQNNTFTKNADINKENKEVLNTKQHQLNILNNNNAPALYTIQVIALENPRYANYFNQLSHIKVSKGSDGLYRYTHGEYKTIQEALKFIEGIKNKGFYDAFVRNINYIDNYNDSCKYNK